MKRTAILVMALALLGLFCACAKQDAGAESVPGGAYYLNGLYSNEELEIGYYFDPSGFGQQFITDQVYQIKYYVLGARITIENYTVEGGNTSTFDFFSKSDGSITIGGINFTKQTVTESSVQENESVS